MKDWETGDTGRFDLRGEVSLFIDAMQLSLNSDVHCNMQYKRIGLKRYLNKCG